MASPLTLDELRQWPLQPYAELRHRLRTGDLLFTAGSYPVSRAIQQVTGSPWSHVGLVVALPQLQRVLLLESVEDMGVRLVPLSKYLFNYEGGKPYRGLGVVARVPALPAEGVQRMVSFGLDELTRPYDKAEIARIVARVALGQGRARRDRSYICSELVHECLQRAGLHLAFNRRGFVSPQDVWVSGEVEALGRVL